MRDGSGNDFPKLDRMIPFRISRLGNALSSQATHLISSNAGIPLAHWRIIAVLGSGRADTSRDLVAETAFDPGFVSRTVKTMEEKGFVTTARDKLDRRVQRVWLTDAGREIFDTMTPIVQRRMNHLDQSITEEERKVFFDVVRKLEKAAERRDFSE